MINATRLGQLLAEEVINEPGPCFYPGKFKPPHKGHYSAAKDLASRNYIQMVYILISRKPIDGITAQDSLAIWNAYLEAEPNPKIKVSIAKGESPVVDIIGYLKSNPKVNPVYVDGGDDETDDHFARGDVIKLDVLDGKIDVTVVLVVFNQGDFVVFKLVVFQNTGAGQP